MAKLLKYSEWESNGQWHCTDISLGEAAKWWIPARMLDMPLDKFVEMLIKEYKVTKIVYSIEYNVLVYSWDNYVMTHKFVLFVNREARKRNFMI